MAAPEFYGPYRVDKTLGQGGMGIVYRAVHAKTLEPVAVKVVSAAVGNHERFRRRFDAEIKTLMKLDHPNIVRLIGFGEEQGQLFYAMELVEGPTLQQHLKAIRRMPWADTIKMGIEIAGALKHAHDSGVIHRDLKPANLLVAPGGRIKLTDFGIAKLFGNVDVTAVGAVMGTADYMAPEQADGGPITPRTDLYALGSVMYACLAGRSPFGGRQITAVLNSLKNDPPPPLDLMNPDVPNELIELVNDLLAKAPVERPPTALAVGNRLRALQMGLKHREAQEQSSVADNVTLPEQVTEAPRAPKHRPPTFLTGSNPDAQTLSSEVDEGTLAPFNADAEGNAGPVTSHYRTVDASDRRRAASPITGGDVHEGHEPGVWWSVAGLVLLLISLGIGAWWMIQPLTADKMYLQTIALNERGDLPATRESAAEFARLYPNDPRVAEVQKLATSSNTILTLRKLQAEANRPGNDQDMGPAKASLLEALRLRERDPSAARAQLERWVNVFGNENGPIPEIKQLSAAAKDALDELRKVENVNGPQRAQQLNDWLDWAVKEAPEYQKPLIYQGIIDMYGNQAWAAEPVDRAKKLLSRLP